MSFLQELKRRNVFRVVSAYLVVGWLILQVSDIILDFANAPEWVGKVIIGLMILGLVLSIVLSWVFEVTADGIRRDDGQPVAGKNPRADRLNLLTIVAAFGVAMMFFWQQVLGPGKPSSELQTTPVAASQSGEPAVNPASIAVLPFADLSPLGDQAYFSDGISEEILNVLVGVTGLEVASRTSAFAFKGQGALGLPAIADALKVRNILEGSVRRSGNQIRITAQLIDAETDKHLWSQTYDRELSTENVFAIQDEIAKAIVNELGRSLKSESLAGESVSVTADTQNLDAYELYLRGREGFLARSYGTIPGTIEILQKAVEIDPGFARAWSTLSAISAIAEGWGYTDRGYRELSLDAARRAIELDDTLPTPYAVQGLDLVQRTHGDFVGAFDKYEEALKRDPKDVNALLWRAIARLAVGEFDAAVDDLLRCRAVDPAYEHCRQFLAVAYIYQGKKQQAYTLFEQGIAQKGTAYAEIFAFSLAADGDYRGALLALKIYFLAFQDLTPPEPVIRALMEPGFDYEGELHQFIIEMEARTGKEFDWSKAASFIGVAFRSYENIHPTVNLADWWNPSFPHFLASPHRKRIIREMGIDDYWRARGFPPQCRPVGEDDFECDTVYTGAGNK
jgi:adenylate cyclase